MRINTDTIISIGILLAAVAYFDVRLTEQERMIKGLQLQVKAVDNKVDPEDEELRRQASKSILAQW